MEGNKNSNAKLHTLVYDIIDKSTLINQEMHRLSEVLDIYGNLPNSLQGMLGKIYRYEGKTQAEIAQIYNIDIKNTIRYVNELFKRGYVKKVKVDNKRKEIYLTREGQRVNNHFMKKRGEILDKVLEQVPADDIKKVSCALEIIGDILKRYNND